jgi:negative regulator of flagellin synthesis FlgM
LWDGPRGLFQFHSVQLDAASPRRLALGGEKLMQIQGAVYVHGPQALQGPHRAPAPSATTPATSQPVDQLELSREAQDLSQARETAGIRQDLVNRVRQEIAAGAYDTEEKFEIALDRLLDELR